MATPRTGGSGRDRVARFATPALLVAVVVLGDLSFRWHPATPAPYHPDEGVWTAVGKYSFQKFFIELDWSEESWKVDYTTFGSCNPTIGKFILGASQFLSGAVDTETSFPAYHADVSWAEVKNERPPAAALEAARRPMRWLFLASCATLLLLTTRLTGSRLLGALAALLFLTRPLVLTSANRAMTEMPATFFSLLTLLLAAGYLGRMVDGRGTRVAPRAIPVGIACGLAVSTKLNTLLIPATIGVWATLLLAARMPPSRSGDRRRPDGAPRSSRAWARSLERQLRETGLARAALVTLGLVFFLFFASNPLLYHHPISGTGEILGLGSLVTTYEVPEEQRLDTLPRRLGQVVKMGLKQLGPGRDWPSLPLVEGGLAALGITALAFGAARRRTGARRRLGYAMLLAWFSVTLLGTLAWVPFSWSRWYMPLEPCWAIAEAMGMATILRLGWHHLAALGRAEPRASHP